MMEIKILKIPKLDIKALEFIHEIRKQIEMRSSVSAELLGIEKEHPTAQEVLNLIRRYQ